MAGYISILLCISMSVILSYSEAYLTMNDDSDFPMGMRYDEGYNIRKVRSKKTFRKTIGSYRLPRNVLPIHYDIQIKPILDSPGPEEELYSAPGVVDLQVRVVEPANSITVHSKGIKIMNDEVDVTPISETANRVKVTRYNIDEERNFFIIFLDNDMSEGKEYNVHIPFVSKVYSKDEYMQGLYRYDYMGSDGVTKIAAVTQWQKDDASKTFPCMDEPDMKAEFTFKIGRLEDRYMSFSNMPRKGDPVPINGSAGWVWDLYERSPIYPTYAMGMAIVTDYKHETTNKDLNQALIKTWVPASDFTDTSVKFAASASGKIMTYFEKLFGVDYPIKKMENMAVPMDLLAMEHPGLVTYRTSLLVWRKSYDTQFDIFSSASLIAHEFAHQWFGNMITCKWWNDFWLNEAFARYYQFIGADESGIDFRAKDRYVIDVVQWAMEFDEGPETVAMRNQETDKVFYLPFHIEYEKGGSIVRMMQSILTEKTFIKALRKYFQTFKWKNTVQDDLFTAFNEAAIEDGTFRMPMGVIMKPWLTKTGFPILLVSRGESDRLYISQQRFILHPAANDKIEPGLWYVPIWYVTKSSPNFDGDNTPPDFIMDPETLTRYIPLNNTNDWIIINPEARGYYRVVYDRALTNLIVRQLYENHTVFNFATRSQLFDDYFRASKARYITVAHAMSLTAYLEKEDDLIVWTTVFNNFRRVFQRLQDTPSIDIFKKFLLKKCKPPFIRMGPLKEDDTPSNIIKYGMFLDWVCTFEDESCIKITKAYMDKWMAEPDKNPIPVDIQSSIYCAAVAFCKEKKAHEFFAQQYHTTKSPRQQRMFARALACDTDPEGLKNLVANAITHSLKDINTTLHGLLVLHSVARNPHGRSVVWDAIKSNAIGLTSAFGKTAIPNLIDAMSTYMSNRGTSNINYEFLDFIYNFIKLNPDLPNKAVETLQKAAQRTVESSMWMDYSYHDVQQWLKENDVDE